MDDTGVVGNGMIEDRPTAAADELEKPPAEQVTGEPETAERQPDERVTSPPSATPAASERPRVWSMPTVNTARKHADKFGRIAIKVGAIVATFGRSVAKVCRGIATFGWHIVSEVPPALRLLGALALAAFLSVAGSLSLDNAFGATCAIAFVPGFSLAFGVVAHRWYTGLGEERGPRKDVKNATTTALDLQRSVEYVDSKLAFALSAFGTERHQEAVVALIQAKTATELSFGTAPESVQHGHRPRIRDGGASQTPRREAVSGAGRP